MIFNDFIKCMYPNKCIGCDEIIEDGKMLCDYCSAFINNLELNTLCTKCGLPKDHCRCKYREYRFVGLIGAFKNDGIAQKAYYSYKLNKRKELSSFFAEKCAVTVKRLYSGIKFDAVMSVPTVFTSRIKRGFDHTEAIAAQMADILNVPYIRGVLKTKIFKTPQHKSTFAKRLENVHGKYYTVKKVKAKRILLFDDISTTGATLDECAKELMFSGAQEVYCIVVLSTDYRKEKDEVK